MRKLKIAAICTAYFKYSHARHIVDRFLEGYGWAGTHHRPRVDALSLYVDQVSGNDLSAQRAREFPFLTIYPTIADALSLGRSELAVDGVIIIGEHGNYAKNEKGQTLYPRYEFFKEIVDVFRRSGRSVPVFNDKHLSWNWEYAVEMVRDARELGFPFFAGSSLPITRRIPPIDIPPGTEVEEAVCVCYGGVDSYDFHGLETIQSMVERRKGGECGVKWVRAYKGDEFWDALAGNVWSRELFMAALCRSHTLWPAAEGFTHARPTIETMRETVPDPVAYHYEHGDGLKCTMALMNGLVQDFNFAARLRIHGHGDVVSTQMYLSMPPRMTTLANFFSPLCMYIEQMFLSRESPYPVERTLLTTGLTIAGVESLWRKRVIVQTPHLEIAYEPPKHSLFWTS